MKLALLDLAAARLDAQSPSVRAVALIHLRGHGAAARSLAPKVAALLGDVEEVAYHATRAFGAIGQGSAESVPVLRAFLERSGAPGTLVRRALFGLKTVGPAAATTLPLLERLQTGPHQRDALEAMSAVAPDAPEVKARVLAAFFSPDVDVRVGALQLVCEAPGLLDAALAELPSRLQGAGRGAALESLWTLTESRPEAMREPLVQLCADPAARMQVVRAMRNLPPPVPVELIDFARRCLDANEPEVEEEALETLAELNVACEPRALVQRHLEAPPRGGPQGMPARVFAKAALALARAGKLDGPERDAVSAWMKRFELAQPGKRMDWSWYTIRDVVSAAVLGTGDFAHALTAARVAQRFLDSDESGVLDFHRTLRELATDEARWQALEAAGVPRKDPYDAPDEAADASPADDYPDFPEDKPPPPPGRLEPRAPLKFAPDVKGGRKLLGQPEDAQAPALAEALQAYFQRRLREKLPDPTRDELFYLSAIWCTCLVEGCGWTWATYLREGQKPEVVVASADLRLFVFPGQWIRNQLNKRDPTALLSFNMIREGKHPPQSDEPVALW